MEDIELYFKSIAKRWNSTLTGVASARIFSPYITSTTAVFVTRDICPDSCQIYTLFSAVLFIRQSSSIDTLIKLKKKGIHLYSLPELHAKVVHVPSKFVSVGSQNLTLRGTKSKEASVVSTNPKIVDKAGVMLNKWAESAFEITLDMLLEMKAEIMPYLPKYKALVEEAITIDALIIESEQKRIENRKHSRELEGIKFRKEYNLQLRFCRDRIQAISPSGQIPQQLASELVRSCAWWKHPKADWVRSRGDAKHMNVGGYGHYIHKGNSFEISLAVGRCVALFKELLDLFEKGQEYSLEKLKKRIKDQARSSVSNSQGNLYKSFSLENNDMLFGNHSINLNDFTKFMMSKSGFGNIYAFKSSLQKRSETLNIEHAI